MSYFLFIHTILSLYIIHFFIIIIFDAVCMYKYRITDKKEERGEEYYERKQNNK
jgi:hypothetical protein